MVYWLLDPGAHAHFSLPKSTIISGGQCVLETCSWGCFVRRGRYSKSLSGANKDILDNDDLSCYLQHVLWFDSCLGWLGLFILHAH